MGDKSIRKRNHIVEKARDVFYKNGYKSVTMKDIVEACGISRGGLYLYFTNTREIFEAVLEMEHADMARIIENARSKNYTPGERMLLYLGEQKKLILEKNGSLTIAVCEYLFDNRPKDAENLVKKQFDRSVAALGELIADGVAQGRMVCNDAVEAARNITFTLEGLKVSAQTIGVTAETVDREIKYIMGMIGMEEN